MIELREKYFFVLSLNAASHIVVSILTLFE
jgi:hypothetical protein